MNYYERHIGDYLKDTAHLSLLEHGIYTRLLDVYYTREGAIPAADAARLVGARSREERAALAAVLAEFFERIGDGFVQARCDREIARFQDKQAKAKRSAEARWNGHRPQSGGNANASPNADADDMLTHMHTDTEGNAPRARPQTPVTSNQTPERSASAARAPAREGDPPQPTAAGAICRAMRSAGFASTNPGDPRLLALLAQGATEEEIVGVAEEAVRDGKGWGWLLATTEGRRADAARIRLAPPAPPREPNRKDRQLTTAALMTGQGRSPTTETIDVESHAPIAGRLA